MARRPHMKRATIIGIQPYEVHDAINTVSRARDHLGNPKMVKAMKEHLAGMNEAVTGGLRPKPPGGARARTVKPPRGPMGGL